MQGSSPGKRNSGEWRGRVEAATVGCRFIVGAGREGNGAGELLLALPARHLDRGGPDGRGQESGAAPDLVLLKTGERRGDTRGEEDMLTCCPSFPFSSRPSVSAAAVVDERRRRRDGGSRGDATWEDDRVVLARAYLRPESAAEGMAQ